MNTIRIHWHRLIIRLHRHVDRAITRHYNHLTRAEARKRVGRW